MQGDGVRGSAMQVVIWNEFRHERDDQEVARVYPDGIHGAIQRGLAAHGIDAQTATLDQPDQGLPAARLERTDVLLWWGHRAHAEVSDDVVDRVQRRVLDGMGLIVLHSGHHSRIFRRLMGTSCNLAWREAPGGERERLWVVDPAHPICAGIGPYLEIPASEMYGEPFDVPPPDELVLISWFQGGEVFRSGCCYRRGRGRVFYFAPGHESFPIYRDPGVLRLLANAVGWANAPHRDGDLLVVKRAEPLEPLV
jgi:trehalose utilization protein